MGKYKEKSESHLEFDHLFLKHLGMNLLAQKKGPSLRLETAMNHSRYL